MSEVLPFISERKLKQELKDYLHMRFDWHMDRADAGETTKELAIAAFFLEYTEAMGPDDDTAA